MRCHLCRQVLEAERAAKEALEAKLEQVRAASERKGAMVRELQRKQEELQQKLAAALAVDNSARLEVCGCACRVVVLDAAHG
jgi:hypothetical protein